MRGAADHFQIGLDRGLEGFIVGIAQGFDFIDGAVIDKGKAGIGAANIADQVRHGSSSPYECPSRLVGATGIEPVTPTMSR